MILAGCFFSKMTRGSHDQVTFLSDAEVRTFFYRRKDNSWYSVKIEEGKDI